MNHVYFDHNATTKLHPEVLQVMLPWFENQSGNPTSRHYVGRKTREAIEQAREQVAHACGAYPSQVIFTASGTEANNFAIKGMASNLPHGQVLTSAIEHPCVSAPANAMRSLGYTHQAIPVNSHGEIDETALDALLATPTSLVSVMSANNETGVIQNIASIAEKARCAKALMHTDAVQMLGKMPLDFSSLNVHAMSVSSHKIHGPQGAAALILDKRVDIQPLLHGGGQERGLRSGTENVAAIVGFGMACELAEKNLGEQIKVYRLRELLENGLKSLNMHDEVTIFGAQAKARLPNTSFFAIRDIEGDTLVNALDRKGFAVASGSACSSDSPDPSHVLLAMGVDKDLARGAIRVSLGATNTQAEVEHFLLALADEAKRLKQLTSVAA
jgi:cysteine desulfurase